jgi:transposase
LKSIAYAGLDVHQDFIVAVVLGEKGNEPIFEKRIANDKVAVKKAFAKWDKEYELSCCYEASSCGYVFSRWLSEMGIACEVIAPSLIPSRPGDKIKTDRRDALKLARLYRAGELTAVRIPTLEEESVRSLVRCRETLSREVKRSRHYVLKFLQLRGLNFKDGDNWTQKHWRYMKGMKFDGPEDTVWREYLTLLEYKLNRLESLDKDIEEIAFSDAYKESVGKLRCFRGIDTHTAMVLLVEIGDWRRFGNARQLMKYLGLVPSEESSGGSVHRGNITKAGNSRCRMVLGQAAWHYQYKPAVGESLKARQVGQPPEVVAHSMKAQHRLHKRFWSLVSRKERCKAATAVARELVGFVWAVMTDHISVSDPQCV